MPDDEHDKPLEEREYPDQVDLDESERDDEPGFGFCRACGEPIYHDSPRCPRCLTWVQPAGGSWRDSRKWYVRTGLYLTRMLVVNWVAWLALAAIAALAAAWEFLR